MSAKVRNINTFFKNANRSDVESILDKIILSERQQKVFDMYYIKKQDVGFIADTLNFSYSVIKTEIKTIRDKMSCFLFSA